MTSPTPLAIYKKKLPFMLPSNSDLWTGNMAGALGETSTILILCIGLVLIYKKKIVWHIPVFILVTIALLYWVFQGNGLFLGDPLWGVVSGGVSFAAIFLATDPVTSPRDLKGGIFFGIGIGILTYFIRCYCGYPEGISYAILSMNVVWVLYKLHNRHVKERIH